jgi:hypothetical protein
LLHDVVELQTRKMELRQFECREAFRLRLT